MYIEKYFLKKIYIFFNIYIYIYVLYKNEKRQGLSLKPFKTIGEGVWFEGVLVRILSQNTF